MGEIYLIRHGQASFGAEDYDQLSPKGQTQCEILGKHFKSFLKAGSAFAGEHKRHLQSHSAFNKGISEAGGLSSLSISSGFNEFDHEEVLFKAFPSLSNKSALANVLATSGNPKKTFHKMFQESVARWISGELDNEYKETWVNFQERCIRDLKGVIEQHKKDEPILVFTSGGPISVILQFVMGLSDAATFALNDNLANSGVTRLLFSGDRISPSYINSFSHLEHQKQYISYR